MSNEVVKNPSHYCAGRRHEPKDVIRDFNLNFNLGSAVKYISRAGRKDDIIVELEKAKEFLRFELEYMESHENEVPEYVTRKSNMIIFAINMDWDIQSAYLKSALYHILQCGVAGPGNTTGERIINDIQEARRQLTFEIERLTVLRDDALAYTE